MYYYLVGIKGSGMAALAKLLIEEGHIVSGCDIEGDFYTSSGLNCTIDTFSSMKLKPYYFYIIGNAFKNHKVTTYLLKKNMYVKEYSKFINSHFNNKFFISVAGSHGKTTTTSLISNFINDSSYIVGDGSGSFKNGSSFVLESCEYKDTFLNYHPDLSLILNIDYDHPDYFKTKEAYYNSFQRFCNNSKLSIVCGDDDNCKRLKGNIIRYGINDDNHIVFSYEEKNKIAILKILGCEYILPFIGKHYAYDAAGAIIIASLRGVDTSTIKEKLIKYRLPKRRFEENISIGTIMIHDYAHHPTEIKSVYNTVKSKYINYRICCIFEPHTITRLSSFIDDFKSVLDLFDETYLVSIFTSLRENKNIVLENELFKILGYEVMTSERLLNYNYRSDTIYIFLGAGNIDKIYKNVIFKKKNCS